MAVEPAEGVRCRSYTYARRYPLVIGKIGGWYPWWGPASIPQYAVGVGVLLVLVQTRGLWAQFSGPVNLLVAVAVPLLLAWSVRRLRVEGRPPLRSLAGLAAYWLAPRHGMVHGRPRRPPRRGRVAGATVMVGELPPADTAGE